MNDYSPSFMTRFNRRAPTSPATTEPHGPDLLAEKFVQIYERLSLGGIWTTDSAGTLTYVSPALAEAIGPHCTQAGIQLCSVFETDDDADETVRNLRLVMSRKTRFEKIPARIAEGQQPRWFSLSGEAQFDPSGAFCGFYGFCSDITEDRRAVEESAQMAMHDPLTGLLNRRRMNGLLDRTIASFKAQNRSCATMLIDLDRFKQVNDTLGHATGDALLRQVADRLVTIVGDRDRVCRLGGDEFQVLLPDYDDRGTLGDLASRVITMVSQPYSVDGARCIIGASIGIAVSPFDGADRGELVRNADLALYSAKHGGRGRFRFFSRELLEAAEERRNLEQDLHDALIRDQFELHYQPFVNAGTNKVTGAEALVRWNHPERGRVSPAQFIPLAEESTLICRIGEWVLRKGCQDAASWAHPLRLAVNVSPIQFVDPGFPGLVAQALAASGLAPERLELEITEGVFLADDTSTDETFAELKRLGVRLALDDFGTGYSSLAYLKSAPFDKIKIDQSFVRGATVDGSRNRAIIAAIVGLAGALGMETTAEGVETFDQLAMLRDQGVSHIQGYIYSQPVPNADFEQSASQAEWGIEPSGYAKQRHDRVTMYRKIGAIHDDYYYTVMLRNLSPSGALIEGLLDVPLGTQFVLDFGDGQLEVATVRRARGAQLGVEFENRLVSDGNGGLCTRSRVTPYLLAAAGLPDFGTATGPRSIVGERNIKVSLPSFATAADRQPISAKRPGGPLG